MKSSNHLGRSSQLTKLIVVVTVAVALFGGAACSSGSEPDVVDVIQSDAAAYNYFGSLNIAHGSSIDTVITGVSSAQDIEVLDVPDGLEVVIVDIDDQTRIQLAVPGDFVVGPTTIVFSIAGEADPVSWSFNVLDN